MNEIISIDTESREGEQANHYYARLFRDEFLDKFTNAESSNEHSFTIKRDEVDAFVIKHGFTDAYLITSNNKRIAPTASTDKMRWTQLRYDSNSIRAQINDVAAYGAYGDPPYEIIAVKGSTVLKVRLTHDIIALTGSEIVGKIATYLKSKNK